MSTIRELRLKRNMTQQQLATALGLSVTSVASWEQGKYDPNAKQFRALVRLFGVAIDDVELPSELKRSGAGDGEA